MTGERSKLELRDSCLPPEERLESKQIGIRDAAGFLHISTLEEYRAVRQSSEMEHWILSGAARDEAERMSDLWALADAEAVSHGKTFKERGLVWDALQVSNGYPPSTRR